MQIFITSDYQISGDVMKLYDERVVYQLNKVLRATQGYHFIIQNQFEDTVTRYQISLTEYGKKMITGKVILSDQTKINQSSGGVIVSILNNFSKMELIVQKLSELGVPEIVFLPTERSVIREISQNKIERFEKISIEAVEQSNGFILPKIIILNNSADYFKDKKILAFDFDGISIRNYTKQEESYYLIGPEGGLTSKDYSMFEDDNISKVNIGQNVLRAETACIIAGWFLVN